MVAQEKLSGAYCTADLADVTFWGFGPFWTFIDEMLQKYISSEHCHDIATERHTSLESHLRHLYPGGGLPGSP